MAEAFDRDALNALPATGPDFADEARHFIECSACGQAFDCRRLGDVIHHEQAEHAPLPVS